MLILPRSSLPLKYGLILPNSPGLIDADYAGPIGIIVHNLRDEEVILPGARGSHHRRSHSRARRVRLDGSLAAESPIERGSDGIP